MALQTLAPEYESVNPFDGKTLETFGTITDEQLEQKIATAQACYQIWRTKSYAERAAVVSKAADLMRANVDAFARTMTLEMGKRIDEARGEVTFSADILTYYAKNAERFLAPVKLNPKIGSAHMESSPIGIVFGVEPWNFPYYQLARVAGPHQMAGNVLMVKHAGIVPRCALAFEKLWIDAGAPAGLFDGDHLDQISHQLKITSSTVQDHIKSMLEKTESRNRSEMIARILGWESAPNPRAML